MIRARAKAPEDIDPQLICCDGFRAKLRHLAGRILEVDEEVSTGTWFCQSCGAITFSMPFRRIHGRSGDYSAVPLPFVDLDEGA